MAEIRYQVTSGSPTGGRTKITPGVWFDLGQAVSGILGYGQDGKVFLSEVSEEGDVFLRDLPGYNSFSRPDASGRPNLFCKADLPLGVPYINFTIFT